MKPTTPSELRPRTAGDPIAKHAAECEECRAHSLPVERLDLLLARAEVPVDATELSRRVLARVRPEIERLAARATWRRIAAVVALSLLPLPAILAYDAYVLRLLYGAVSALLPASLAAYLVLSYGAAVLLLFATTYAAIPVFLMRGSPRPSIG